MNLIKQYNQPSIFNGFNQLYGLKYIENEFTEDDYNEFWNPNFDIIRNDDYYLINGELAGTSKSDINIELTKNSLKISGKRSQNEDSDKNISSQINYGSFVKYFNLDDEICQKSIVAKIDDGILKVKLPILEPKKNKTKQIKIN